MRRNSGGRKRTLAVEADIEFKTMYMNKCKLYLPKEVDLYSTQKGMIIRILNAINNKQNALIESPTGSGKTLALLSSTCSWLTEYEQKRRSRCGPCLLHGPTNANDPNESDSKMDFGKDDSLNPGYSKAGTCDPSKIECTCMPKIRIYYCTRTHKQIAQVVKEYKRLPYWQHNTLRHTILASREQSCINSDVREMGSDLNTNCKKITEPKAIGCTYKDNLKGIASNRDKFAVRNKMAESNLRVWDIEELVDKLPKIRMEVCPYFLTNRELTKDANLIFCPFNYLIDPIIRESSDVCLKNSIIILDEAHNIEDVCRTAASFSFTDLELAISLHNLKSKQDESRNTLKLGNVNQFDEKARETMLFLADYIESMEKWQYYLRKFYAVFANLTNEAENVEPDKFTNNRALNLDWEHLSGILMDIYLAFDSNEYKEYSKAFNRLVLKNESGEDSTNSIANLNLQVHSTTIVCVEKLLLFFKFYSQSENKTFYTGNIEISPEKFKDHSVGFSQAPIHDQPKGLCPGFTVTFRLFCMMPSIACCEAFSQCHSIILASGTLCPLNSFCGELKVDFTHQMEGEQIIAKERIFATALSKGPTNTNLRLTYNNLNNPSVVTELARIVFDVCAVVPGGVLVFVSSYAVLQKLQAGLDSSGLMKQLKLIKEVFVEPKGSSNMNSVLTEYEKAIKIPKKRCSGCVMFAVFRGKVSEGLDFSDNKARAVVSIGIPYPSVGDCQVVQKKAFNDRNSSNLSLSNGSEWYETQAYRAVNQALGRCLRHKGDWGALILIDERYSPRQTKISAWVRQQMKTYQYGPFLENLKQFVNYHISQPVSDLKTSKSSKSGDLIIKPVKREWKNPVFK